MATGTNSTSGGDNVIPFTSQSQAVDRIDMELAEIHALVDSLRFMWENAEPAQLEELRPVAVTLSYVVRDKIDVALRAVPQAYVARNRRH